MLSPVNSIASHNTSTGRTDPLPKKEQPVFSRNDAHPSKTDSVSTDQMGRFLRRFAPASASAQSPMRAKNSEMAQQIQRLFEATKTGDVSGTRFVPFKINGVDSGIIGTSHHQIINGPGCQVILRNGVVTSHSGVKGDMALGAVLVAAQQALQQSPRAQPMRL